MSIIFADFLFFLNLFYFYTLIFLPPDIPILHANDEKFEQHEDYKEGKIDKQKLAEIFRGVPARLLIFAESDKTCKARNGRSQPADVHARKKRRVRRGEFTKERCRRDVGNHLAGKNGNEQCVFIQKSAYKPMNGVYTRHIAAENEEGAEG